MKRQVQETGIRKWYGGDWVSLQEELFKVIDGHYEQYGNMIIKGCEVVSGTDINAGIVGIWGKDDSNNNIYKVAVFEGLQAVASWPVYLTLTKVEEKRLYNTGTQKNVTITYKAIVQYALPTGEYLIINQDGNNKRYRDAIQNSNYRFVTDNQISSWNSKAAGLHTHAAIDIIQTSSYRFVTDAEKLGFWTGTDTILSTNKKIGINNNNPSAKLDISYGLDESILRMSLSSAPTLTGFEIKSSTNGDKFLFKTQYSGSFSTAISIDRQSGDVETLGLTSAKLLVNNVNFRPSIEISRASGQPSIKASGLNPDSLYLFMDSSGQYLSLNHYVADNVILAKGGGNVGINNSSPSEKLDVTGNIKCTDIIIA